MSSAVCSRSLSSAPKPQKKGVVPGVATGPVHRNYPSTSRGSKKRPATQLDQPLDFSAPTKSEQTGSAMVKRSRRSMPVAGLMCPTTAPSFLASPTSMASSRSSCTPPQTEPLDLSLSGRRAQRTPPMTLGSPAFSPVKPLSASHNLLLEPSAVAAIQSLLALSARWQPPTPSSVASVTGAPNAAVLHAVRLPSLAAGTTVPPVHRRPAKVKSESEERDDAGASDDAAFVINPATGNKVRRNYKNMTKERRQEANARERTRVHTIGAAFERLRSSVPANANTTVEQIASGDGFGTGDEAAASELKLSKLGVLRIACKYILLLAAMSGKDYSAEQSGYTVEQCLDMLNETVANECKAVPSALASPQKLPKRETSQ